MMSDRIHTPISTEARVRLRTLWAEIATNAARVERAAAEMPPDLLRDVRRCFSKGAARAAGRIHARLKAERVHTAPREGVWRYVRLGPVTAPPALEVAAVVLDATTRPALRIESFGLSVTRHACARMIDRSGGIADPLRGILQAHSALLKLKADEGEALFLLRRIALPAAGGLLLASSQAGAIRAIGLTWVDEGQLHADQEANAARWAELVAAA